MAEAQGVNDAATATKQEAVKVRRKSRDLEESLGSMAEASEAWNKLGQGRRARRGSRDLAVYNDDALKAAFDTVDTDSSGFIDKAELSNAIKAMDPSAKDETIEQMMSFADANDDGKCDFDEFKKIMLYKPPAEPSGSLPQEKAE